ncbi:MAG: hypothetical protein LBR74_02880 [Eubacterium sp.]|jgi:hypothetical protein|nr:hypothetical protein [Eubacterium sp.]
MFDGEETIDEESFYNFSLYEETEDRYNLMANILIGKKTGRMLSFNTSVRGYVK